MDLPPSSEGPTTLTPGPPHPSISDLKPILVCSKYSNLQYRRHDEDTNTDLDVVEKKEGSPGELPEQKGLQNVLQMSYKSRKVAYFGKLLTYEISSRIDYLLQKVTNFVFLTYL